MPPDRVDTKAGGPAGCSGRHGGWPDRGDEEIKESLASRIRIAKDYRNQVSSAPPDVPGQRPLDEPLVQAATHVRLTLEDLRIPHRSMATAQ